MDLVTSETQALVFQFLETVTVIGVDCYYAQHCEQVLKMKVKVT